MAKLKKVAASLIDLNTKQYAILSPGVGYYKNLWGSVEFHDNLPRASGCFHTLEDAIDKRKHVIELAEAELAAAKVEYDIHSWISFDIHELGVPPTVIKARQYFIDQAETTLKIAKTAIIVEIGLTQVA